MPQFKGLKSGLKDEKAYLWVVGAVEWVSPGAEAGWVSSRAGVAQNWGNSRRHSPKHRRLR